MPHYSGAMRAQEVLDYVDPKVLENAGRVFAIFDKAQIEVDSTETRLKTLSTGYGDEDPAVAASTEPFAHQPVSQWRYGTAFLIAENLVATAHHVLSAIEREEGVPDITEARFVRDYVKKREVMRPGYAFSGVYRPTSVTHRNAARDWALIALHPGGGGLPRPVRPTLDTVAEGHKIYCLGHPTGLPMKIAYGSIVKVSGDDAKAHIDTYSGNSGSPVFCADTHRLIGMLTDGQTDYDDKTKTVIEYDSSDKDTGEDVRLLNQAFLTASGARAT